MTKGSSGGGEVEVLRSQWWCDLQGFGEFLRAQREELSLTQVQMAQRVGMDQSQISRYERGLETPKSYPAAKAIAECYQLDQEQTSEWLQLIFGINPHVSREPVDDYGRRLLRAESLVQQIKGILGVETDPDQYDYFLPLRQHSLYPRVDSLWGELQSAIYWLMQAKRGFLTSCLLSELGGTILHYMDVRGYYRHYRK